MIIAKGAFVNDNGAQVLLLGLSKQNIMSLQHGRPISRDLTFAGIPYHLVIVFGEDEIEIHRQLRTEGIVDSDTEVKVAPPLRPQEDE